MWNVNYLVNLLPSCTDVGMNSKWMSCLSLYIFILFFRFKIAKIGMEKH